MAVGQKSLILDFNSSTGGTFGVPFQQIGGPLHPFEPRPHGYGFRRAGYGANSTSDAAIRKNFIGTVFLNNGLHGTAFVLAEAAQSATFLVDLSNKITFVQHVRGFKFLNHTQDATRARTAIAHEAMALLNIPTAMDQAFLFGLRQYSESVPKEKYSPEASWEYLP